MPKPSRWGGAPQPVYIMAALQLRLLAWLPFLCSAMTRIWCIMYVVFWIERHTFGFAAVEASTYAFYGAALFICVAMARSGFDSLLQGPTPDTRVGAETGTFRRADKESVPWAACGMRGWRPAMEDAHVVEMLDASLFPDVGLFAVLDGHGGAQVSALAKQLLTEQVHVVARQSKAPSLSEALEKAVPCLDALIRAGSFGLGRLLPGPLHPFYHEGSTAVVAAVDFSRQEIVTANIGDSRGILIRNGKAIALSEDHKPEDPRERRRIENAGGKVIKVGPCWRVDGNLNLSRALGDFHLKANPALPAEKQKVSAFPDMTRTPYREWPQELLVMGCDGLFERKDNQDIADIVWPRFLKGMPLEQIGKELLHACCARANRGQPMEMGTDNETVVIAKLPALKTPPSGAQKHSFLVGDRVRLQGLQGETAAALNGQSGIIDSDTKDEGRYHVRLDDGVVKAIKPANLQRQMD